MLEFLGPEVTVILMFLGLLIGLFMGHPLAFVLGGLAAIFGYFAWGPQSISMFANRIYGLLDNYLLVAVPMFILMANFLERSGVADQLFGSLRLLFGKIRGGLGVAVIVVCTILAACSGVIGASVASMGVLALPVLLKYGYDKRLAAGTITSGGTLGILIPPSIMLVMMADMTGLSVGKLFVACVIPGLLLSAMYIIYILVACRIKPEWGPAMSDEELAEYPMKRRLGMALKSLVPPLLLIVGVLGSIFSGIATPTEASGVGALLALLMSVAYRKFSWKMLWESVMVTARTTSMAMLVLVGATCFTGVFLGMGGGEVFTNFLLGMGLNNWGILIVMMLIIFVLGMFIDWMGIVYICFPIFMPIITKLGFDPFWFTVITAVNLQNSFLSPPFGYALFYLKGVAGDALTTIEIYKGVVPYIIIMLIGLILCIAFPEIVNFLPRYIS